MNFEAENYNVNEIKKIFTNILPGTNFFSDFTLQDVETAKKKLFFNYKNETFMDEDIIKNFIDKISNKLVEDKFSLSIKKPQDVVVKNTVKDYLNPNYRNTVNRITQIDSQYRNNLLQSNILSDCDDTYLNETHFTSQLTDALTNVVSLKVESVSIPYTFYNIEKKQGNHILKFDASYVIIDDGFYNITSLVEIIKVKLNEIETEHNSLDVTYNVSNGKVYIHDPTESGNHENVQHELIFYDNLDIQFKDTNINNSLGWMLGFRDISYNDNNITSSLTITSGVTYISKYIAYIPNIKYFILTLDDYNNNQSNKPLVQLDQGKEPYTKPTNYYKNINEEKTYYRNKNYDTSTVIDTDISGDICLDSLKLTDLSPYTNTYKNRGLTRKQFYTQAAINDTNNESEIKIIQEHMPNILAIIPFEPKSLEWGKSIFFSDKNHYSRDYHGPVDIEKITVKLFDDKGNNLNLNGNEWSMTVVSKHLYKY